MANQNPQPDIYEINLSFANSSPQGTKLSSQVYTFQSSFEEVRVYAVMINIVNSEMMMQVLLCLIPMTIEQG